VEFKDAVELVGKSVDGVGVAVMVVGFVLALVLYLRDVRGDDAYRRTRHRVGQAILLGLEVLVAGDIIRTVAVAPSFSSVGVLAVIVLIRTFLSMTLEVEVSGAWPWQRSSSAAAGPPPTPV
jgi:uncharacterized membrane protein